MVFHPTWSACRWVQSTMSMSSGAAPARRARGLPVVQDSYHAGETHQQKRMQAELIEPDHVAIPHRLKLFLGDGIVLTEIVRIIVELLGKSAVPDHIARYDVQRAGEMAHLGRERAQDF